MAVALEPIRNTSAADIRRYPLFPNDIVRLKGIRVYNCGQGDAIAILGQTTVRNQRDPWPTFDDDLFPIHVDYGGYKDNPHSKNHYRHCRSSWPLRDDGTLVLSHWDQDHYWTAKQDSDLHDIRWLVPRQKVSPRIALFSTVLQEGSCWPESTINKGVYFRTEAGDEIWIEKLAAMTPPGSGENRNNSGLAISIVRRTATEVPDLVICPGDAPYSKVTHLQDLRPRCRLVGIVAYHHGSKTHWSRSNGDVILNGPIVSEPTVIYSASPNNQWGHPHQGNYRSAFRKHPHVTTLIEHKTGDIGSPFGSIDLLFP